MARAYVQFAVAHPSHYRVMFGGFIESAPTDDQIRCGRQGCLVMVDTLVEQQNAGDIRRGDPVLMARFVGQSNMALPCWSLMDSCPGRPNGKP